MPSEFCIKNQNNEIAENNAGKYANAHLKRKIVVNKNAVVSVIYLIDIRICKYMIFKISDAIFFTDFLSEINGAYMVS